ncbi:MAG: hypothetical protein DBY37_03440 [Desulfovibrionaceae bacterium]|nr:MAG: hypothetical protein DBY37_03440 [Desulfovibrionaceae bacterium]
MKEKRLHRLPLFVKFMFPPEGEGFRPQSIFDLKMLPESSGARLKPRRSPFSGVAAIHLRRTAPMEA